jgi:signal peptidase II
MPIIDLNLPSWLGGGNLIDIRPGKEIFGAIWNLADLSISIGVGLIIVRYRKFFKQPSGSAEGEPETDIPPVENSESVVTPIEGGSTQAEA